MSLREDVQWLEDAADSMLHGALPVWPRTWTTKTGENLAALIQQLHQKRWDEYGAKAKAQMDAGRFLRDEQAARETNRILTAQLEAAQYVVETFRNPKCRGCGDMSGHLCACAWAAIRDALAAFDTACKEVGQMENTKREKFIPLAPNAPPKFNGGQRCDMAVGPCACGAWH
jgi:hypothetical protein